MANKTEYVAKIQLERADGKPLTKADIKTLDKLRDGLQKVAGITNLTMGVISGK